MNNNLTFLTSEVGYIAIGFPSPLETVVIILANNGSYGQPSPSFSTALAGDACTVGGFVSEVQFGLISFSQYETQLSKLPPGLIAIMGWDALLCLLH